MADLKKHRRVLLTLIKAEPKVIKAVIRHAPSSLIRTLSEIAFNTLRGVINLTPSKKRKLAKFKTHLRTLANKRNTLTVKKRTLQRGGFVSLLASVIAPLLLEGVTQIVKKIKKKK